MFRPEDFAELTTPSAPYKGGFAASFLVSRIGVGTVVTRPSLRTVQVLFAHTALQSSVSIGEKVELPRHTTEILEMMSQREQAVLSKVRVGPALVILTARANAPDLLAPAQQAAQTSSQPAVQRLKRPLTVALAEEVEPAPLKRRQFRADHRQAARTVTPCQGAQPVPQFLYALLTRPSPCPLVVPAQIIKTLVKMDDSGLFRTQLQSQPVEYSADSFQHLFGFFPARAQCHHIVRIADPCRAPLLQRHVQLMEKDVRQNRRDDSALRSSRRFVPKVHLFHDSGFQKASNQVQNFSIRYLLGHSVDERFMGNRVVTLFNVQIDYPDFALRQILLHLPTRRLDASPRTESMAVRQKFRFEDRFDHAAAGFLHHSIPHRRQSQGPELCTARFRDILPPDRTRTVPVRAQLLAQLPQFCFRPVRKFRYGDAIHSRSRLAFLARDAFINPVPSGLHVCWSDHLVIQRVPLAPGSSKRADRGLHRLRPHRVAGRIPAEDIFRFPNPVFLVSALNSAPCVRRSHLNSCVPFPRTGFAFSSSFSRPVLHRQGFGTMDALTPLPTGLPACEWPHRFGLRRFAPTLGLRPALARSGHPVRYSGTSGHPLGRGLLGSPPRFFRTAQSGTTWGRPRRYGSLSPSRLGASTWWAAWPRFPLGLIRRFNFSAYSSVLCLLAHRTFPRGNALPVGYLARRASTRIGLQPIRSGDYPATPTPPLQGGENVFTFEAR